MTRTAVFSISTADHFHNAEVTLKSFSDHCDYSVDTYNITLEDIKKKKYNNDIINNIYIKYFTSIDSLRWSLKPALILYFLKDQQYTNVVYLDNDIYFVNKNTFLIDYLDKGILLTKHNRPIVPTGNKFLDSQFICNFTDGFFNAGFIGANHNGIEPINWWLHMNYWKCSKIPELGLYVDQKYLDVLALEFSDKVRICDHPGCNLAMWNSQTCSRSLINNVWKINSEYDPIFCHFSSLDGGPEDPMLQFYLEEFKSKIQEVKHYKKRKIL